MAKDLSNVVALTIPPRQVARHIGRSTVLSLRRDMVDQREGLGAGYIYAFAAAGGLAGFVAALLLGQNLLWILIFYVIGGVAAAAAAILAVSVRGTAGAAEAAGTKVSAEATVS